MLVVVYYTRVSYYIDFFQIKQNIPKFTIIFIEAYTIENWVSTYPISRNYIEIVGRYCFRRLRSSIYENAFIKHSDCCTKTNINHPHSITLHSALSFSFLFLALSQNKYRLATPLS